MKEEERKRKEREKIRLMRIIRKRKRGDKKIKTKR